MQNHCDTGEQEFFLEDSIKQLDTVNRRIAKLLVMKEELVDNIIGALEHEHEGQKTYEYGVWRLEVKTPFVYSLNKKEYESGQFNIPEKFNPIKQSVSYSVDKGLCDKYMQTAPKEVREMLVELIDKKPGKANVCIKERI